MDLQLHLRVLWRFRVLVLAGLMLALSLSFLSFARVSFANGRISVSYRQNEQWESLSTLFITSRGFPWGQVSTPGEKAGGDSARLSALAGLYNELATSDGVLTIMRKSGPINGVLQAFPVFPNHDSNNPPLPMMTLSAIAASPADARALSGRHLRAFLTFLDRRQAEAGIPPGQRVAVEVVRQPESATLLQGRKKTRPIMVFLTVLIAVMALAFVLENLRPRVREVFAQDSSQDSAKQLEAQASRRPA